MEHLLKSWGLQGKCRNQCPEEMMRVKEAPAWPLLSCHVACLCSFPFLSWSVSFHILQLWFETCSFFETQLLLFGEITKCPNRAAVWKERGKEQKQELFWRKNQPILSEHCASEAREKRNESWLQGFKPGNERVSNIITTERKRNEQEGSIWKQDNFLIFKDIV